MNNVKMLSGKEWQLLFIFRAYRPRCVVVYKGKGEHESNDPTHIDLEATTPSDHVTINVSFSLIFVRMAIK